jgi:hypothetical protein
MTQYIIKVAVTAVLVVAVAEASKRSTFLGGLLASLPVVSILALTWLYFDTRDTARVASLSVSIFWLVLPSLLFFALLPGLLRLKLSFPLSLVLASGATAAGYAVMVLCLSQLKVKL